MSGLALATERTIHYYKVLQVLSAGISAVASVLFTFIVTFNMRAIKLYTDAVGRKTVTQSDLLHAVTFTYLGQIVLGLMVMLLAWAWWATVRGARKRFSAIGQLESQTRQ